MDYQTKPTTRAALREYAAIFRSLFGISVDKPFPVLEALDLLHVIFPGTSYEITEDYALNSNVPAQCVMKADGTFVILIKNYIYEGAYKFQTGGYLNHILHEICHRYLFFLGFTPITQRSFSNKSIPSYCSVEWQAKALCGEIMVPHIAAKTLSVHEIVTRYHTSYEAAAYQKKVAYR